jgi:benzoate-CoA ligase
MDAARSPLPVRFNSARHILSLNAGRKQRLAYRDDHHELSYGELDERVRRFAAGLQHQGIQPEQRILLVMQDSIDLPVAFLGALFAGVVPVPVNTLLPATNYAYMLEHSDAKLIIVSASALPAIKDAMAQTGHQIPVVISGTATDHHDAPDTTVALHFDTLIDVNPLPENGHADTHADQFAFWLYSSGSTGQPKGAVHSHANLYWTAELYGKPILQLQENDLVFSAAKLFFAYGLGNALIFPLSVGASTLLMAERATPEAVFQRLQKHQPTVFFGVPTLYVAMLASDTLPKREQINLRLCASAGESLPKEIGEKFSQHFGCDILDGLGSTEMLHIFISNRSDDLRYGATGKPVPGYAVELRDEQGHPVAQGEIGDLYIQGPSAAHLYWNQREKTLATFQGPWVKSGDKYQVDANGFYVYAGRSDDMLKVSGQYVSPIEVENALMGHEAVLESAVVGKPDNQGLMKTIAYVVLRNPARAHKEVEAELKAFVKTCLAPHKYPREIIFVSDLPKTATGKIQRFRLRESNSHDL